MDIFEVEKQEIERKLFSDDLNKEELYIYTLRHLAFANSERKDHLTHLRGLSPYFFLANEMIRLNPEHKYGTIVMDITQFKAVNEFCGRKAGDGLLIHIADWFLEAEKNRELTISCHIRADSFALCTAFNDEQELADIVEDIMQHIRKYPMPYHVHPNFGICAKDEHMPEASSMKDRATMALALIKGKFYADYSFYDYSMQEKILRDRQVENDILGAIENGEIVPFLQPKVDMRTGEIIGAEALVRWISKDNGMIPPGKFLPTLEENGFIITIDKLIWRAIFELQKKRMEEGKKVVPISVNLSRVHVYDNTLVDTLIELQKSTGVDPSLVWIELTESAMVDNAEDIFEKMRTLQSYGFKISMDDFGTGYSSLFMLKKQPVDEVKMDREFVLELDKPESIAILKNTARMLEELGKKVIVEGIETDEQRDILLSLGVNRAQGFRFYRPMPVEEFERELDAGGTL